MQNPPLKVANLHNLIGHEVRYQGRTCRIIEVIEDIPALILQQQQPNASIQPDQHGEARRKVPDTITLPVIDRESGALHPAFSDLNISHLL